MPRRKLPFLAAPLTLATFLTGCSSPSSADKHAVSITTAVPAAKSSVDTVTWNLGYGEPATLDPALSATESISSIVGNMCEGLTTVGADNKPQPALASSIDHPDPLTYVINLRKGVTFWDGKPMTAEDVRYSIQRVLDVKLGSSWIMWASRFDSVKITGTDQLTIKLKSADSTVPNYFAMPAFNIVEKAYTTAAGKSFGTATGGVMCTGPYKLAKWNQGKNIILTRNDSWWNTSVKPKVASLRFSFITDPAAQAAALSNGDVDGQYDVPIESQASLAGKGSMLYGRSLGTIFLSELNSKSALSDPSTRRALQAVIDYEGITKSVYKGTAQPLRALVPPEAWGYGQSVYQQAYNALPKPAQDQKTAKSLVAKSTKARNKIVLAYTTANTEQTEMATVIANEANQVGMNIQLKPLTGEQYSAVFGSAQARQGIDLLLTVGYLDFQEPLEYYLYFTSGSYYNFGGYSNKEYDAALAAAMSEGNDDARARDVAKAQAIMSKDLVNIPLVSVDVSVFYSKKLTGLVPRQSYLYTPWATTLGGG